MNNNNPDNNNVLPPQNNDYSSTFEQNIESLEIAAREQDLGNSELESNHLQKIADKLHETFPKLKYAEIRTFAADVLNTYRATLESIPEDQIKAKMGIDDLIAAVKSIGKSTNNSNDFINDFLKELTFYIKGFIIQYSQTEHSQAEHSQAEHGEDEMSEKFPSFVNESSSEQSLMNFDNIQQQAPNNNLQQQPAQSDDPVSSRTRLKTGAGIQKIYKGM